MPLKKMKKFSLATQTLFSELEQKTSDAIFLEIFEKKGSFKRKKRRNRYYWYFQYRLDDEIHQIYAGPVTDAHVTEKVKKFNQIKESFSERREIVRSLIAAGLPRTDDTSGLIIETFAKAGFFRIRGVLIGTTAFQCYSGILGAALDASTLRTQDADFAQYLSIARLIDDSIPSIDEILRSVDPTFRDISHHSDGSHVVAFVNHRGYRVEFLTPNRGSNDYEGVPVRMPALGGVSAIPLRFLDFLIKDPIRSVLLYEGGVPVTIPAPGRYAVHKLIISERRHVSSQTKIEKDLAQASALIEAMGPTRHLELAECWIEAWEKGPRWREALKNGVLNLSGETNTILHNAIAKNTKRLKRKLENVWLNTDEIG